MFLQTSAVPRGNSPCVLERHHGVWLKDFLFLLRSLVSPLLPSMLLLPLPFSLLSSLLLPPSPGRRRGVSLHALIGFIGGSSVVEDAAVALNVVLDKDGSAHNIRQSSSLFHLIKKTTFDGNGNILQCQGDSCRVIHLLTVSPIGSQPGDLSWKKRRSRFCPKWISVCVCVCLVKRTPLHVAHIHTSPFSGAERVNTAEQTPSWWINKLLQAQPKTGCYAVWHKNTLRLKKKGLSSMCKDEGWQTAVVEWGLGGSQKNKPGF